MSDTSAPKGSVLLPIIGFLLVTGSFGIGVALSYRDPHPETAKAEQTPPEQTPIAVYFPMGDPIQVTLSGMGTVVMGLSLSLYGLPEAMHKLQEVAKAREPELRAAVLQAVQAEADRAADVESFRRDLPARLRDTLNGLVGTEELPAPVVDVLFVSFVVR